MACCDRKFILFSIFLLFSDDFSLALDLLSHTHTNSDVEVYLKRKRQRTSNLERLKMESLKRVAAYCAKSWLNQVWNSSMNCRFYSHPWPSERRSISTLMACLSQSWMTKVTRSRSEKRKTSVSTTPCCWQEFKTRSTGRRTNSQKKGSSLLKMWRWQQHLRAHNQKWTSTNLLC